MVEWWSGGVVGGGMEWWSDGTHHFVLKDNSSKSHRTALVNVSNLDGAWGSSPTCPIQAMPALFLCYLRFLLFNPTPMNQQEGKERTEGDEATLRDAIATITRVRSSTRFWSASARLRLIRIFSDEDFPSSVRSGMSDGTRRMVSCRS